jgi:glycosyltransferase involved in cell wall biosynthesis
VGRDIAALRSAVKSSGAQIDHCHGSQDSWIPAAALVGLKGQCKFIRTKHNSYPAARHCANRWLYNTGIDHTIAVAGPIREELVHDGFVAENRASVLHAGLDDNFAERVTRPRTEIRRELLIDEDAPLIGLVGRLAPDKGQDTLLDAALIVRREIPSAHFVLVGTGGDWDRIRGLIEEKELESHVTWAGFRDDVPSVTAALDISLLAARACDASSTVLKEAMVLGVPVIGTDVGGTVDILKNGEAGLLIEPGSAEALAQAILKTLNDPQGTEARVQIAREHVTQYLSSRIAEATEAIYQRAIDG